MNQQPKPKLTETMISGSCVNVRYIETQPVKTGVECDIYSVEDDETMDLAVVRVQPGQSTPMQLVKSGTRTTEIFAYGSGKLIVTGTDGIPTEYSFPSGSVPRAIDILVGETMQWTAGPDEILQFYEVCVPPYEAGRFEDLP